MTDVWHTLIFWVSLTGIIAALLYKYGRNSFCHELLARDVSKGHNWIFSSISSQSSYCNICETLILVSDRAYCTACGIYADRPECIVAANSDLICKKISTSGTNLRHHWVKGNLPPESFCEVCEEECGTEHGLSDFQCCWCQRCSHSNCIFKLSEICDLGLVKKFVIPPNCVTLTSRRRMHNQVLIKKVIPPNINNWSPVIVIGNCSSGSSEGELILASFRRILNPSQVLDLSKTPAEQALEWCHLLPFVTCRVVVAGGDGTVGWIFNTIYKSKPKNIPYVSILPIGTGNDLSRVLGWGESHSGSMCALDFLLKMDEAKPGLLDRWNVHFTAPRIFAGLRMPSREIYMNNYLSVGVDALVTLNFHLARQSPFYIFNSRFLNKLIYFTYGTKDVLLQECKDLHKSLELWMDGKRVQLPELEALVVLNIPSWGAGVRPWTMGTGGLNAEEQCVSDGKLEVFCVTSSFHIAQLQLGITEPVRIGQCLTLDVRLKGSAPMQVDGEPWEQTPGLISLRYSHQAKVLISDM